MLRNSSIAAVGVLIFATSLGRGEPARTDSSISVPFSLKAIAGPPNLRRFACEYKDHAVVARFIVDIRTGKRTPGAMFYAGEGRFVAVKGSNNKKLLAALKLQFEAKRVPRTPKRVPELRFAMAVLGENQTRDAHGSFVDKPRGTWIVSKIFLPRGGDEGEFFMNLDPIHGKGEFSIKDADYGDYLLAQLAKVL